MNKSTKIEWKPIDELIPYEHNAKKHTKKQIANLKTSFEKFGWQNPVLIDDNNVIICGHGRILGAREAGMDEAPCIVCKDLTEKEIKDYRHLDNLLSEGDYLQDEFDIDLPDLSDFDFSEININIDLDGLTIDEPTEVIEDEIPEEAESRCKLGDLWQLGNHRLICGDSTDSAVIDRLMDGEKADITITSPPYGMGRTAHLRKHLESGKSGRDGLSFYGSSTDDSKSWLNLMNNFYNAAQKAASVHFINVMMVADNKQNLVDFVATHSNDLVDIIVWNKHTCPPQIHEKVLNNGYEFVFVFDNEQNTRAIRFGDFKGTKSNYIETQKEQNQFADIHKAVYSIEFVSKILDICNCAHSVFDPFGGTGTTLIACEQLNRNCYICELDEHYCNVIIQRWENFTGEKAKKIN